ncbi:aminotransferase class V-fold PLP-dependent enzyme [Corynebacterium sp. H113]|uniref:aminotransferase class V-fold PLP-dependent enzyme n=1 Tax=Corynebacterium sp. H113 TaxID=3133419 RepID=UPI0030951437
MTERVVMAFDVPTTRGFYSSLSDGWTYLNGGERAQVPERVLSAMTTSFRAAPKSLPGEAASGSHSRSLEAGSTAAGQFEAMARRAFADVAGAPFNCVVLGSSREMLVHTFVHSFGRRMSIGRNIVVTRTGDVTMQLPFRRGADMFGAELRIAEADLATGAVPEWQYGDLVDEHTSLVVVPAADPFVGTVAPVAEICQQVHESSDAWVLVDASAYAASRIIDMDKLGADIVLLDAAAWGGPDVSALVFRDPSMFERMTPMWASQSVQGPQRLEIARVSPSLLGGVSESVRHLADLDRLARGTRRHRIVQSMPQVERYLSQLTDRLIDSLELLPRVHIIGVNDNTDDDDLDYTEVQRIPRLSFIVYGVPAKTVVRRLMDNGLVTSVVNSVDSPLMAAMGLDESDGAVAVGLQPFNTPHDVDQLVRAVASLG